MRGSVLTEGVGASSLTLGWGSTEPMAPFGETALG